MEKLESIYTGVIKLDSVEIPCYVLNDEKRVLSQREVVKLITGGRDSGDLGKYLSAKSIQPFLPEKFQIRDNGLEISLGTQLDKTVQKQALNNSNVLIFSAGTRSVNGILASDVVDICNSYLKARLAGALQVNQSKIAEQCEIFISACAKTGIDAVIDEATGYQYYRQANSLQEKFSAFLQEEYREWTLTFPRQFFMQLYKLEGIKPPVPLAKFPKRFGKYVMQFVYDTLDPDIADYLRKNNQDPGGKKHHHQLFSDFGYNSLSQHILSILGIMKASPNMERFKENIAIAYPNARTITRNRQSSNKISQANREDLTYKQLDLFEYLPSINTPEK